MAHADLTQLTDFLALFACTTSTTPTTGWKWPLPITTPPVGTGLQVSLGGTVAVPALRLNHMLGGPVAPSRHSYVVPTVTIPLPQSLGHGLSGTMSRSPQSTKGKEPVEIDDGKDNQVSRGSEATPGNLTTVNSRSVVRDWGKEAMDTDDDDL